MATGGCFCGQVRVEFTGPPMISALCHCLDCRKLTGGLYTYSFIVNSSDLTITGSPKEVPKVSDSGNHIKNYFCSNCGTPLYGLKIKANGDLDETVVVRAGILDDIEILNRQQPEVEIYTNGRVKWIKPVEGANQFIGMPPLP